eukprot:5905607-Pleurochrysis_carterae.AAC.1
MYIPGMELTIAPSAMDSEKKRRGRCHSRSHDNTQSPCSKERLPSTWLSHLRGEGASEMRACERDSEGAHAKP